MYVHIQYVQCTLYIHVRLISITVHMHTVGRFFQSLYISLISQICILFVKIATFDTVFTCTQFAKFHFVNSILEIFTK